MEALRPFAGEIEIGESCFGPQRMRGAGGKTPVLGLHVGAAARAVRGQDLVVTIPQQAVPELSSFVKRFKHEKAGAAVGVFTRHFWVL